MAKIKARRIKWLGHIVLRSTENRIIGKVAEEISITKGPLGRFKLEYFDNFKKTQLEKPLGYLGRENGRTIVKSSNKELAELVTI